MHFERILAAVKVKFVTPTALLALAISMMSAAPSSATSTDVSLFLSAPYVQGSHVAGPDVRRESFNSLSTCTGATAVGTMSRVQTSPVAVCAIQTVQAHGGASVDPDVFTPLSGSGSGSKFATNGYDEVTFDLASPVKYVGVWWSAGNNPNSISFYDDSTLIQTVTAEDIVDLISSVGTVTSLGGTTYSNSSYWGNPRNTSLSYPEPFAYLNLFLSGDVSASKIVISGGGFEFDNLVTKESAAVPLESMVFVSSSSGTTPDFQTVTWNPTNTSVAQSSGSVTPNQLASVTTPASGGGAITYSVIDADSSGCSVDSSTGAITHTSIGDCVVRATAAAVSGTPNYFASYKDVTFTFTTPDLTCPIVIPYLANNASTTLTSGIDVSITDSTLKNGGSFSGVGSYWADTLTNSLDATFEISPPATKFGFEAFYNADAALVTHEIVGWTAKNSADEVVDSSYTIDNRNTTSIESVTFSEPISKIEFTYLPRTGGFGSVFKTYVYADAAYCASSTVVTYDAGDGTVSPVSAEWSDGDDPLTLPTPTRDGYHFAGWFDSDTDGTLIGEAGDEYTPEADVTLYAQWQILCESTTTTNGRENIVTFNYTGECYWEVPAGITEVEYLVVAGGGGGGGGSVRGASCAVYDGGGVATRRGGGGGGGAGGTMLEGSLAVEPGDAYVVQIGVGGSGGAAGTCPAGSIGQAGGNGSNGDLSRFGSIVSYGGEGGIGAKATGAGSHGGSNDNHTGGQQPNTLIDCPKTATVGCFAGAGGAGAGADGESIGETAPTSEFGGDGGAGAVSEITGITYAGGGGGGNRSRYSEPGNLVRRGGSGGTGGGGAGNDDGSGFSGTNGLGGGGGGGRGNGNNQANLSNAGAGGAGGSGTVVLRYFTPLEGFVVSFDSRGGTPAPETIEWEDGSDPIVLPSVTLDGFELRGWFTPSGALVGKPGVLFTPAESIELEAKWRFIYPDPTPPVNDNPNQVPAPTIEVTSNNGATATVITKDPSGLSVTTLITAVNKDVAVKFENGIVKILDDEFVGTLNVTLTSTNSAGSSTSKTITLTVHPQKPESIEAFFTSAWNNLRLDTIIATRTKIVWSATPGAIAYEVLLDGKVIGTTSKNEFVIGTVLNPKTRLKIRSIGPDNTKSELQKVRLSNELMQIARVNFAPASAELTDASKAVLDKLIKRVVKQNLRVIDLRGYTDNQGGEDGAIDLSKARALAVRAYLRSALTGQRVWIKQGWFGNSNPAMPNETNYSLALNRRVDIYVGK